MILQRLMQIKEKKIEERHIDIKHDPQEEEYAELASSEGDKFDSRLFWFAGGIGALSLGYFQATGLLQIDALLIAGYTCLIIGIVLLLASLQFTSYIYGELSVLYGKKNRTLGDCQEKSIQKKIDSYGKIVSIGVLVLNVVSMVFVLGGAIMLVIFMFVSA